MKWICYDESETFSIEARTLEQAQKLASVYEAKVLGPLHGLHRHKVHLGKKIPHTPASALRK